MEIYYGNDSLPKKNKEKNIRASKKIVKHPRKAKHSSKPVSEEHFYHSFMAG